MPPPILLLHGLGGCAQDWELVAPLLDADVLAPDAPAHGGRPYQGPLTFADLADDAFAVLDRHDLGRVYVAGVSLGAATALTMATAQPDRIEAMFLLAPAWWKEVDPPNLQRLKKIGRVLGRQGTASAWEIVSSVPPIVWWDEDSTRSIQRRFLQFDALATGRAMVELPQVLPSVAEGLRTSHGSWTKVVTWTDDVIHPVALAEAVTKGVAAPLPFVIDRPHNRAAEAQLVAELITSHRQSCLRRPAPPRRLLS